MIENSTDVKPDEDKFETVDPGICTRCGEKIGSPLSFGSVEALRTFMVTGLCKTCQKDFPGIDEPTIPEDRT